jgi:GTP cyclohydrolase I
MKTETLTKKNGHKLNGFSIDDIGDDHLFTGLDTPMKPNAFEMSNEEKKRTHLYIIFRNNGRVGARFNG